MRLQISHRHPLYYHFVGLVLDLLRGKSELTPDHVDYLSFRPSQQVMQAGWVNPRIAGMK